MENQKYLYHVVLISFLPEAISEVREEIIRRYLTLGEDCGGRSKGIFFWSAQPNTDLRKNIHMTEIAIFKDQESFEEFKNHPKHKEVVELLKKSANWFVGDITDTFPTIA